MPNARARTAPRFRRVREFLGGLLALVGGHLLLFGLATIAAVLVALFFAGLSSIAPSSPGHQTTLSNAIALVESGDVRRATLRDQDARLEIATSAGKELWASYPHADSYTTTLLDKLQAAGVATAVDSQAGKPTLKIVIQFLLPILILVTLFAFFTTLAREQGGTAFAAFSKWT